MPPSTPRKSCLASSSSSSSSDCSSPTNSSLSTTATPPTPLLSNSSYDSPFGTPSRRPKKTVRFANPIREYQIVSATFAVVTEVPEEEEEERVVETTSKKGRKRKECQSSNMCYMQKKTTICPCRYPTCPMYQPPSSSYSPPLLPPPMAPLPKPKKTKQKTQQQPQQGRPFKVDLHMTFNFDESGLVIPPYPSVPALMTSSYTQHKEYAVTPAYPGQWHYSPPPYLGTTATYADPYASPPRKLRRKPSFEFHRGGMARSINSSEDSSIEGMRARRGRSNTSESTNSSPLEFVDPDDVFRVEEGRWEVEEKYLREMRKSELEKRRMRERRPHRTDLGGGLAGGTYKDPQTYYTDEEGYDMLSDE